MAIYDSVFDEIIDQINEVIDRALRRKYTLGELVIYMTRDYFEKVLNAKDPYSHRGYNNGGETVLGYKIHCVSRYMDIGHPDFRVVEI